MKKRVRLDIQDEHGVTKRQHLEKAREAFAKSGKVLSGGEYDLLDEELNVPLEYSRLVMIFEELNGTRQQGFAGPSPITYTEIKNYIELTATELDPWEIETIRQMDNTFLIEISELQKGQKDK